MAKQYTTNNHTNPLDFPVAGGGIKRVEPGETEHFEHLDPSSKQLQAWQHVSMISISDKKPEADEKPIVSPSTVVPPADGVQAAGSLETSSSGSTTGPSKSTPADSSKS